ncbi:MAG: LCP family protein [Acidimicrobiia bacterium]
MSRRPITLFLVMSLAMAACSGSEATENAQPTLAPSTTSTTSTTAPTTTTSAVAALTIAEAPPALTEVVEGFYGFAKGTATAEPAAPEQVVAAITPSQTETPTDGTASVGTFAEQATAVVEIGPDVFLAVDDGSGWRIVGGEWPSLSLPAFYGEGPRIVAVVGSDARPGQDVDRTRADSIHFVGLDGNGGGAVVGLPRDSYVAVPGFGRKKITASLALGGPETMMAAFNDLTGLPLEGYVLTGFAGFESLLTSVLGGVEVDVPFSINDKWAHVALSAGKQLLNGAEALGFARARKTVPGGDFGRSGHQGVILIGAAEMVKTMGYGSIPGLMEMAEEHLTTNLTPEQLLTFSAMAISADLESLANVVAPGRTGTAAGASVVFLSDSVASLWADLADGRLEG